MNSTKKPLLKNPPYRAVFYARVSSDSQVVNTSINVQIDRGKSFINSQGWALDKVFIENGESGKSTIRPTYQKMLCYLRENPVDILLTFKLDRLSRSLRDILNLIHEELNPKSIALQSVSESFNSRSSEGMLLLQMLGSFAEFERKRINERTMSGKIATIKKGRWCGGKVPFAYRRIKGAEYDFDIYPDEAKIVRKIFRLYSKGAGYLKISKAINDALSPQGIAKLIKNPFYIGRVKFNNIIQINNHPGIISEKLFRKCQKIRQNKRFAS